MTKLVEYTERSQEEAKAIAAKLGLVNHEAARSWTPSDDFFDRTGFLAMYHADGDVFVYPLWEGRKLTTDFPDRYHNCPSLEWFMSAKLGDNGKPELIGANGDKLVW